VPRAVLVVFALLALILARLALLFVPGAPSGGYMLGFGFALLWPEVVVYLGLSLALVATVPSWRAHGARSAVTLVAGATTLHVGQLGGFMLLREDLSFWPERSVSAAVAGGLAGLFIARLAPRTPPVFALGTALIFMTTPLWRALRELGLELFAAPFAELYRWAETTAVFLLTLPTTLLAAWLARRRTPGAPVDA